MDDKLKGFIHSVVLFNNCEKYSDEEIITVFSMPKVITFIAKEKPNYYANIIQLNIEKLNEIYTSKDFYELCKICNTLDLVMRSRYRSYDVFELIINNTDNLRWCAEKFLTHYNDFLLRSGFFDEPNNIENISDNGIEGLLYYVKKSNNSEIIYAIMDYYLENTRYLPIFKCLKDELRNFRIDLLNEYLLSRKDKITKVIQENSEAELRFIIDGFLPKEILKREVFHERDNMFLSLDSVNTYRIIVKLFNGKYEINEDILRNPLFIEKYIEEFGLIECYYDDIKNICHNKELAEHLIAELEVLDEMRNNIIERLDENIKSFGSLCDLLKHSEINPFEIEFLKDMHSVLLKGNRIREIYEKYRNTDIKLLKESILKDTISKSQTSIINSIDNPLSNLVDTEYNLEGRKVIIPTKTYDGEKYVFLVKTVSWFGGLFDDSIKSFSTITDKNRSMYYGDSRIKVGYVKVNPEDIIQVNQIDSISRNLYGEKYRDEGLKYSEWISLDKLNKYTLESRTYNEIRIKGEHIPDYVISFDEPDEKTIAFAYKYERPLVKILRKSYPNAIENNDDIYSDWQ